MGVCAKDGDRDTLSYITRANLPNSVLDEAARLLVPEENAHSKRTSEVLRIPGGRTEEVRLPEVLGKRFPKKARRDSSPPKTQLFVKIPATAKGGK